jgi:hypothetical protein
MCGVTGEVLWGPEKGRVRLMNASKAPATTGWLVLATAVFLVLAAG